MIYVTRFGTHVTGKYFDTDFDACEYAKNQSKQKKNKNVLYRVGVSNGSEPSYFEFFMNGWFILSSEQHLISVDRIRDYLIRD